MPSHFGLPVVSAVLLVIAVVAPTRAEADDLKHRRQPRQIPCADLANLNLPDTTITLAQEVPAGPFPFGDTPPILHQHSSRPSVAWWAWWLRRSPSKWGCRLRTGTGNLKPSAITASLETLNTQIWALSS